MGCWLERENRVVRQRKPKPVSLGHRSVTHQASSQRMNFDFLSFVFLSLCFFCQRPLDSPYHIGQRLRAGYVKLWNDKLRICFITPLARRKIGTEHPYFSMFLQRGMTNEKQAIVKALSNTGCSMVLLSGAANATSLPKFEDPVLCPKRPYVWESKR